ncbi:exocyst complex component EXO84C [Tanacetum coccineum]|uniref:Exocyst complex component EXO84C n=1 Tax=Tanacetum coccineum TaxID=301880 RepID=A0ABQ5F072_9ASTR
MATRGRKKAIAEPTPPARDPRDVETIEMLQQRIQELEFQQLQQDSSAEDTETESSETESEPIIWDIGDEEEEYPFINKHLCFQEEPIMLVEEDSCPVYDTDNEEEESMPVYDTDIEDVIEEEEGFVGKGGIGREEENIEDDVVVANDICSSIIQTTLNVDVEEDINTKSHELMLFGKSIIIKILGTGMDTQDTSPLVLLFFYKQRFIFNAGEGLQRFCTEHKIKLSKIDYMFLSRVCSETAGGLPGLLLTLAGNGEEGISVNVWGPSDINYLVDAMKSFIPNVAMVHSRCFGPSPKSDKFSLDNPGNFHDQLKLIDDEVVKITSILLQPENHGLKEDENTFKSSDISILFVCELLEIRGKFDLEKEILCAQSLDTYYADIPRHQMKNIEILILQLSVRVLARLLKRKSLIEEQLIQVIDQTLISAADLKMAVSGLLKLGKGPPAHQLFLKAKGARLQKSINVFLPSYPCYPETFSATLSNLAERQIELFVRLVKENAPSSETVSALHSASVCVQASLNHRAALEPQGLRLLKVLLVLLQPYMDEVLELNFKRARKLVFDFSGNNDIMPLSPHLASPLSTFAITSDGLLVDNDTRFIFKVKVLMELKEAVPFKAETDSQQLALMGTAFTIAEELLLMVMSSIWSILNESKEAGGGVNDDIALLMKQNDKTSFCQAGEDDAGTLDRNVNLVEYLEF